MTIDWWTLAIQLVNVIVLVWLLGRFFWRPVAGMIAQRRAAAQGMLAEAQAQRDQAAASLAEAERARADVAQEREAILAAARTEAEHVRAAGLQAAAEEAASLKAAARAAVEAQGAEAREAWAARASGLAVDIATRLAARLNGPAVRAAFLDWLLQEIRGLPDAARRVMTAQGVVLEAVSAVTLDAAEQDRCRLLIGEALGDGPMITFTADPALIAGLELRAPHAVISNSWRADLDRILESLKDGDGH